MTLSLLILAFLIFMVYWWGSQGLFSAFLHVIATVAAGALALALWEPLALNLMNRFSAYAWGASLLGAFIVLLLVIRFSLDRAVRSNMYFSTLVNYIGGGVCGLFSGVLSAGLLVIGLSFLPLGKDILGYDPMNIGPHGEVAGEPDTTLFPAVNKWTAGFYNMLSMGAFSTRTPLAVFQPNLAEQAARDRLTYDPNSSRVAAKDDVTINALYEMPAPLQGIDDATALLLPSEAKRTGYKLVVVDTTWTASPHGTYDSDATLRVPPTQVRLVTQPSGDASGKPELHPPVGYARPVGTGPRQFQAFADAKTYAYGTNKETPLSFAFVVPTTREPKFVLIRHTRFPLPEEPIREPAQVAAATGQVEVPAAVAQGNGEGGPSNPKPPVFDPHGKKVPTYPVDIDVSDVLPMAISKNYATGLKYHGDEKNSTLESGHVEIGKQEGINPRTSVSKVYHLSHQTLVRVTLNRDKAQSAYGASIAAATMLQPMYLTDALGNKQMPIGWFWKRADGSIELNFVDDRNQPFRSAKELPIHQMKENDQLIVYFLVPKDATAINSVNLGEKSYFRLEPPLPLPK